MLLKNPVSYQQLLDQAAGFQHKQKPNIEKIIEGFFVLNFLSMPNR